MGRRWSLDTFYAKDGGPLGIWRQWAPRADGQAMKGGHFFRKRTLTTPQFSLSSFFPLEARIAKRSGAYPVPTLMGGKRHGGMGSRDPP
jgi:hypothetical protein